MCRVLYHTDPHIFQEIIASLSCYIFFINFHFFPGTSSHIIFYFSWHQNPAMFTQFFLTMILSISPVCIYRLHCVFLWFCRKVDIPGNILRHETVSVNISFHRHKIRTSHNFYIKFDLIVMCALEFLTLKYYVSPFKTRSFFIL